MTETIFVDQVFQFVMPTYRLLHMFLVVVDGWLQQHRALLLAS